MVWLSHWKFRDQLEGGDEVNFCAFSPNNWMEVKEYGIRIVYEEEEKLSNTQDNFTRHRYDQDRDTDVIGGDLSGSY